MEIVKRPVRLRPPETREISRLVSIMFFEYQALSWSIPLTSPETPVEEPLLLNPALRITIRTAHEELIRRVPLVSRERTSGSTLRQTTIMQENNLIRE